MKEALRTKLATHVSSDLEGRVLNLGIAMLGQSKIQIEIQTLRELADPAGRARKHKIAIHGPREVPVAIRVLSDLQDPVGRQGIVTHEPSKIQIAPRAPRGPPTPDRKPNLAVRGISRDRAEINASNEQADPTRHSRTEALDLSGARAATRTPHAQPRQAQRRKIAASGPLLALGPNRKTAPAVHLGLDDPIVPVPRDQGDVHPRTVPAPLREGASRPSELACRSAGCRRELAIGFGIFWVSAC